MVKLAGLDPALMAGLPASRATVGVGPPKSPSSVSMGLSGSAAVPVRLCADTPENGMESATPITEWSAVIVDPGYSIETSIPAGAPKGATLPATIVLSKATVSDVETDV